MKANKYNHERNSIKNYNKQDNLESFVDYKYEHLTDQTTMLKALIDRLAQDL